MNMSTTRSITTKNRSTDRPNLHIPSRHLGLIDRHLVRDIAIQMDLKRTDRIKRFQIITQGRSTKSAIPLHVIAGHDDWYHTLHALRFWFQLSQESQIKEVAKCKSFDKHQKRLLLDHRAHLGNNLPAPILNIPLPSNGISNRQSQIQIDELVNLSTARCLSRKGIIIAQEVKSIPSWDNRQLLLTRPLSCSTCGFVETQQMIESVKGIALLEGEKCIQCSEYRVQREKALSKDALLLQIYTRQLKLEPQFEHSADSICVSMRTFIAQHVHHNFARAVMHLLPREMIKIKIIRINLHTSLSNHDQISNDLAGAKWENSPNNKSHPNIIMHDDNFDLTMVLLPLRLHQKKHNQNFVMLGSSNFDPVMINKFSKDETNDCIRKNHTGHRPGPASGVYLPGDASKSFTQIAQKRAPSFLHLQTKE